MKKLCLLASILPMFGCSNFVFDTNANIEKKQPASSVIIENKTNNTSEVEINNTHHRLNELDYQVPKVKNKVIKSKSVVAPQKKKDSAMLNVVLIKQNPELRYGCEVTSLAMVLNYAGAKTNKMDLFRSVRKDADPLIKSQTGDILRWGNPADGFVGDMTGRRAGYAVFDQPMIALINQKLPGRAFNLTNKPFDHVLNHVSAGYPVVVWTTGDYRLPDRWEGWYHGKQYIRTPLDLHAVVLVGYDRKYVYLNDPLSGRKQVRVDKQQFIASWKALKNRAVSYK
ncbi:C39 family peptidase [Neobacillus drentensis]|uniref:C39 family peptidase n=1 Tax=Neobacillus drentensis TaxID=220684 RepID=UPI00300082A8